MQKLLLVYNPVSGNAEFKNSLDSVVESFQRRNIFLTLYRTRAENTIDEFVECVKNFEVEGIISAGGDGTLHRVVNWIKKAEINLPLGVIGSGTSNDFATHLKIDNLENYFDIIAEKKIRPVDLGLVNGKEYFINVASAGVFTSIAHEVDSRQKNSLGKIAYYLRGIGEIPKFKSVPIKIIADGKIFESEIFVFLVLNSPAVASMKKLVDSAKIDDGKTDLIAVKKCNPKNILTLTKKILTGQTVDDDKNILHIQAKNFEISSTEILTSDIDGEIGDNLPLKIETVHQAINFFAP